MLAKKNLPLLLGLAIPVLMIIFVAASIYLPGVFVKPTHNFIYTTELDTYTHPHYQVDGTTLTLKCAEVPPYTPDPSFKLTPCTAENAGKLFLEDVAANRSSEISYAEAQKLILDSNTQSSDGYQIVSGGSRGVVPFIFEGGDTTGGGIYIKGHSVSKKLNIQSGLRTDNYSSPGFLFLGWVGK